MSEIVDQAAEVANAAAPGDRRACEAVAEALAAAGLLRPEWATPEAKAVLDAAVERYRTLTSQPTTKALSLVTAELNFAVVAYVASLGGATPP